MAWAGIARQDAPSEFTDGVLQQLLSHRLGLYPVLARLNPLLESFDLVPTHATRLPGDFHRLPPTLKWRQELRGRGTSGSYGVQRGGKSLVGLASLDLPRRVAQG